MFVWKLLGYAEIAFTGLRLSTLLNRIAEKGIALRKVQRASYTRMTAIVPGYALRSAARDAQELCVQMEVLRTGGLVRAVAFFRRRWWLAAGLLLALIFVCILSSFCIMIEINGLQTINEFAVYDVLTEYGAGRFVPKSEIDLENMELALRTRFDKISYANAWFDGVKLVVQIDEGQLPPALLDDTPVSIAAEKSGVIVSITVGEGMAMVTPGQVVRAGDVLISGAYLKKDLPFLVAARGKIEAQVDYMGTATATFSAHGQQETGRQAEARYMRVGTQWVLLEGGNPFEQATAEWTTTARLGENMPLCVEILRAVYKEVEPAPSKEAEQAAQIAATEQAYFYALSSIPEDARIVDFHSYAQMDGQSVTVTATVTTQEEIGVPQTVAELPAVPTEE